MSKQCEDCGNDVFDNAQIIGSHDPDDTDCSWQQVYRNNRIEIPYQYK